MHDKEERNYKPPIDMQYTYTQCAYDIIGIYSGTNYSQTYVVTFLNNSLLHGEVCDSVCVCMRERERVYIQSLLCGNMVVWSLDQIPSLVV